MSFTYPLGLLGLIAVPILIILYIIKSHYTEQTVASVYLWQLSEKFLKKKKRVRFGGLLSLILQILAVTAISLTIAGPKIILPDAANDYCFILDASGSMSAQYGDTTRFEAGKQQIRQIISQSKDGSTYSLIYAGSTTFEAYKDVDDKETALAVLDNLECEWSTNSCVDALAVAQEYYSAEHSPLTYLVTDKAYETENINLINMSQSEENYAFVSYTYEKGMTDLTVSGQVISYDRDAQIVVELYMDGEKAAEVTVAATAATATDFEMTVSCEAFRELTVRIANEDALMTDNEGVLYTVGQTQYNSVLIVSDAPSYLEFAMRASEKTATVDVVTTKVYSENQSQYDGYGLYVFDTCADTDRLPDELPKNASIWFFNLQKSILGTGFSFREVVEAEGVISSGSGEESTEIDNRFEPTYTDATSSTVKYFMEGLLKQNIAVKKYSRYVPSRNFTNLMYQNNDSLIFVGENDNGNRQVVFAFDLHDTDYALKADFLILMDNLLDYSFPSVVEETLFTVGDELTVNVPSGCTDLLLEDPSGKISYPDFSTAYAYCKLDQVGTYKITACVNGVEQYYYVYSQLPAEESYELDAGTLTVKKQSESSVSDGYYDKLIIYFIILAVAFLLDWGVYCYEQYQLR